MFSFVGLNLVKFEYAYSPTLHPYKKIVIGIRGYNYDSEDKFLSIDVGVHLHGKSKKKPLVFKTHFVLTDPGLIEDFRTENMKAINSHIKRFMAVAFPYIREAIQKITSYTLSEVKLPVIDCSQLNLDSEIVLKRRD